MRSTARSTAARRASDQRGATSRASTVVDALGVRVDARGQLDRQGVGATGRPASTSATGTPLDSAS